MCITAGGEVNERTPKGYEGTGAAAAAVAVSTGGVWCLLSAASFSRFVGLPWKIRAGIVYESIP